MITAKFTETNGDATESICNKCKKRQNGCPFYYPRNEVDAVEDCSGYEMKEGDK
jgi:hypothetical protein